MDPISFRENALEKRRQFQMAVRAMGINEDYISLLVDRFYDRVRAHPRLGSIFETVVGGHWPHHLSRMKAFWNSLALRSGIYLGKPVEAHQRLSGIEAADFETWLRLFEETLNETAPNAEVVDYFMRHALNIANRLQEVMLS